jgi:hypothetical protein
MAHGQWTVVEARGVLEAWKKKSGQSLEGFVRSRGLVPQRLLHWWKQKGLPAATSGEPSEQRTSQRRRTVAGYSCGSGISRCCRVRAATPVALATTASGFSSWKRCPQPHSDKTAVRSASFATSERTK